MARRFHSTNTKSKRSLYMPALASFTMGAEYDSTDAIGFIRLFGLQMRVGAVVRREVGGNNSNKSAKRAALN